VIDDGEVDEAVLALLRAQVDGNGDPIRVGDASAPAPTGTATLPPTPYAALLPLDGAEDGNMRNPHTRAECYYRVRVVGKNRRSVRALAEVTRFALIGRNSAGYLNAISGTGWTISDRRQIVRGAPVQEAGSLLWQLDDDFRLRAVPA
jgi:hypothetical protein